MRLCESQHSQPVGQTAQRQQRVDQSSETLNTIIAVSTWYLCSSPDSFAGFIILYGRLELCPSGSLLMLKHGEEISSSPSKGLTAGMYIVCDCGDSWALDLMSYHFSTRNHDGATTEFGIILWTCAFSFPKFMTRGSNTETLAATPRIHIMGN